MIISAVISLFAILAVQAPAPAAMPPLEALLAPDGSIALRSGASTVGSIEPGWAAKGWTGLDVAKTRRPGGGNAGRVLDLKGGGALTCAVTAAQQGESVLITYLVTTTATLDMESVHASLF